MPDYVSAYEWQQKNGLTRQQVIELAEIGPTYWKAIPEETFQAEGFALFKGAAIEIWHSVPKLVAVFSD